MKTYSQFRPTQFDSHIPVEDKENWLVFPCGRNRDSDCLEESNFAVGLDMLGGEGEDVCVCRFGHWGCGWFELILVNPKSDAAKEAVYLEEKLYNYPVLDEDDLTERQLEAGEIELEDECPEKLMI